MGRATNRMPFKASGRGTKTAREPRPIVALYTAFPVESRAIYSFGDFELNEEGRELRPLLSLEPTSYRSRTFRTAL